MFYEIVIDPGETPNKCTISPLTERSDFHLFWAKGQAKIGPLQASFLLHHEGKCLSTLTPQKNDLTIGIAAIDCVWNRVNTFLNKIQLPLPELVKIPNGFVSAYPRHSKNKSDPEIGLATIEAVFTASALLGNWDPTLFAKYYFGRTYIEQNAARFLELGIKQASDPSLLPFHESRPRTSLQRRQDRGRGKAFTSLV